MGLIDDPSRSPLATISPQLVLLLHERVVHVRSHASEPHAHSLDSRRRISVFASLVARSVFTAHSRRGAALCLEPSRVAHCVSLCAARRRVAVAQCAVRAPRGHATVRSGGRPPQPRAHRVDWSARGGAPLPPECLQEAFSSARVCALASPRHAAATACILIILCTLRVFRTL